MQVQQLKAYLSNSQITDPTIAVVIETADGVQHAIQTVTIMNGDLPLLPAGPAVPMTVLIQLAT